MMQYRESDLDKADKCGMLPEGTLEYARGIIELEIQGKRVSKTRKQWADYICGVEEFRTGELSTVELGRRLLRGIPFRSYDSDMTKGAHLHSALLELEVMNKANPDVPLEELVGKINAKEWRHL